jgi:hypothetical protein
MKNLLPIRSTPVAFCLWLLVLFHRALADSTHSFEVVLEPTSWHEARSRAESRGGHLATFTSDGEYWEMVRQVGKEPDVPVWIGATDEGSEGRWRWITGEPWGYTRWSVGSPDNAGGTQHYGLIWTIPAAGQAGRGWDDYFAADASPEARVPGYVVEYDRVPMPRAAMGMATVVNGFVVGIAMIDPGYGYTNAPVVRIVGGGGSGALAEAVFERGRLTGLKVLNAGSGYVSVPGVEVDLPPFPPRRAQGLSEVVNGLVTEVRVTDPGYGYESNPAVMLVGGGGTGATATTTIRNGVVASITVTAAGTGYTSRPMVRIASPPFSPSLRVSVSKVAVEMRVVLGKRYRLESSSDLSKWTPTSEVFTADDETLVREFEAGTVGRYFRIVESP